MKSLSLSRLLVLASISFALTLSTNTLEPSVYGHKILQLVPDKPNTALGLITFLSSIVAIILPPYIGALSDRTKSRWGQRIPYFIGGGVLLLFALNLIAFSKTLLIFACSVVLFQIAFSIIFNPWKAQYPDLVPQHQRGMAAGIRGISDIAGLIIGRAVGGNLISKFDVLGDQVVLYAIAIPAVAIIIAVGINIFSNRHGLIQRADNDRSTEKINWMKLYSIDLKAHPAFGWWFVNRFLFWAAFTILSTFLLFFAIDVIGLDESQAQDYLADLALFLGSGILILSMPAGWLADKYGRKPLVIFSGLLATVGSLVILFVRDLNILSVGGLIIGSAAGIFISSNFALISDIVPKKEAGRYMGIASIAGAIGSAFARLTGGLIVDPLNSYYSSNSIGYLAVYAIATILFLLSAIAAIKIPVHKIANIE